MLGFIDENGVDGFTHLDDATEIWERFGVTQQRTYVYINDDGTWETAGYGSLPADVEALIAK